VDYRAYDPYPKVARPGLPGLTELSRTRVEDLPHELFEALGDGDLLVVDTTHTVKTGGDVNHIVGDTLGVPAHVGRGLRPLLGRAVPVAGVSEPQHGVRGRVRAYATSRERPQPLRELVPGWRDDSVPGAFWIRRR
jgi:hypothetical protein